MRIRTLVVLGTLLAAAPLAAQRRVTAPAPSPLFRTRALLPDSTHIRPTYWKEGALVVGIPVGLVAASGSYSLCRDSDTAGPHHCTASAIGGGILGFVLGGTVGALIGGQIPKHE